jgi:hypothetical protein
MRMLICLDDTDNLESRGTGELAAELATQLEDRGWARTCFVTRHQLFVHPDVPYTSHNSAMCFTAELDRDCGLNQVVELAGEFLERESASGSDPGLCVMQADRVASVAPLMEFGLSAKRKVLRKDDAYGLARDLGVHLSEHGGTGQGVVGALAGVGLRLGGNDGRVRGKLHVGEPGHTRLVAELRAHPLVGDVRGRGGGTPAAGERVALGDKIKMVFLDWKSVLLLDETGDPSVPWRTCSRQDLGNF